VALTRSRLRSPHRQLTLIYGVALTLIAALSIATHVILGIVISDQQEVAQIVNMTGRQRMLSQRVAWLSSRYARTGDEESRAGLRVAITEMTAAAELLRSGTIDSGVSLPLPPGIAEIYRAQELDRRLAAFLEHAREIAETDIPLSTQDEPYSAALDNLDAITAEASGPILETLNDVVTEYVRESEARITRLQDGQRYTLIVVILTLVAEALFVFRPLTGRMSNYFERMLKNSRRANAARRAVQRANAARSSFLANMSHELRTPMAGIMGICDLLLASAQSPEQVKMTRTLRQSAQSLLDLLNDVLDLAKLEAGRMTLEPVDFKLSDVLTQVRDLFGPSMSEKGLRFTVSPPPEEANILRGDPKRLRQVLCNLVGNALKFTEHGAVDVTSTYETAPDGDLIMTFTVSDTGIGISQEGIGRLFTKFEQADGTTARRFGGTGLGLSICKQIAEAMDGGISVASVKGEGTTLSVSVRMEPGDPAGVAAGAAALPLEAGDRLQGLQLSVLVAESDATTQFLLAQTLSLWGHRATTVGNGQEAIERAAARRFDVILVDMQMPVVDGDEVVRCIRAGGTSAPIIGLTADSSAAHWNQCLGAGCNAVVMKPVAWPVLAEQMAVLVRPPRRKGTVIGAPSHVLNPVMFNMLKETLPAEVLTRLLDSALASIAGYKASLESDVAALEHKQCQLTAHAMRGVCSQIGADEVAQIGQWIEEHSDGVDSVRQSLPLLEAAIVRLRNDLRTAAA